MLEQSILIILKFLFNNQIIWMIFIKTLEIIIKKVLID